MEMQRIGGEGDASALDAWVMKVLASPWYRQAWCLTPSSCMYVCVQLFTKQSLDLLVPSFCACIARHVSPLPSCPQPVEVQAPMRQLWMSLNALNVFGTEHDTVTQSTHTHIDHFLGGRELERTPDVVLCGGWCCGQVPLCESFGESLNLLLRLRFAPKDSVSDEDWRRLHTALHKLHSGTTSTPPPHTCA